MITVNYLAYGSNLFPPRLAARIPIVATAGVVALAGWRLEFTKRVANDQVRGFWEKEFTNYNPRYRQEAIAPIQNKIGAFLADPRLRRAVTPGGTDIRFREVMDTKKILLVNLGKGLFGDDSASLLGALLVNSSASCSGTTKSIVTVGSST